MGSAAECVRLVVNGVPIIEEVGTGCLSGKHKVKDKVLHPDSAR